MVRRQQSISSLSTTWQLVKAAGFCFLVAQISWIVGPNHASSRWFIYIAAAAFAVYGITVAFGSFLVSGFSWRLGVMIAACFVVSIGIVSTMLPALSHGGMANDLTLVKIHELAKESSKVVYRVPQLVPEKELQSGAQLVFKAESRASLQEARKHLLSIPENSRSYPSAQALLNVVQLRLDEGQVQNGAHRNELPIGVVAIEQSEHGLRVTLRNNTPQNVRNIRYRVSYFRMTDGMQIRPDIESVIRKELRARATQKFDLPNDSAQGVYRSFAVVRWDGDTGR